MLKIFSNYSVLSLERTPGTVKVCSPYPEFVLTVFVLMSVYCTLNLPFVLIRVVLLALRAGEETVDAAVVV